MIPVRRLVAFSLFAAILSAAPAARVQGELRMWHPVSLTFDGPRTSESASPNPFLDFRLTVTFTHARSGRKILVPGFYAADGNAAFTSAEAGNTWRALFLPDAEGEWSYSVSFRTAPGIAIQADPLAGAPAAPDGASGKFRVSRSDKKSPGHHARGILQYNGSHYLKFAGTGERFLKGGADSPENFLAYHEFDGTWDTDSDSGSYKKVGTFIHKYSPHVPDWKPGDPAWKDGRGKGIIGALNYLASKGVNSVYFLTYNLDGGDGRDTWMWSTPHVRDRFDCSKLDQWEIVFSHMDRLGIMLHVVTQETENDRALGGGPGLNDVRKLYLRELVARFAHHPALIWNLGEENNTPDADRKAIAAWIRALDPYRHPITVHTHNKKALTFYDGILGDSGFEATSIQGEMQACYNEALELRRKSAAAGRKWAIFYDEQAPDNKGTLPDSEDPNHDEPRAQALWGNLMGGGSGVEWYFGHAYPNMDINLEDFRSRDRMWDQTRIALDFFRTHLPFWEMEPAPERGSGAPGVRVLAKADDILTVHLPVGGEATVQLGPGKYQVHWFNPRSGGPLKFGTELTVSASSRQSIGRAPEDPARDWVALIRRK